jgi:Leucine-rich repeat (LRR) protein
VRLDCNRIATLPKSFTSMTNLRVVDLRGNALRALPEDIGCLVRLETLDVGENALETLPKSLGNCRRLRRLDVSANALRSTACLDALGNCIDLESVDASKNRSMCGALPVSWGCLIKLKEINVDETSVDGVPSEIFLSCESLQTLSARRCAALDVAAMKETEGYEHYEARRKGKHDKQLSSRVLMDEARLDERLR